MERVDLSRAVDPIFVNYLMNHEDIRPWVANSTPGEIDIGEIVRDTRNVVLTGRNGAMVFIWTMPGIYDVHTMSLKVGRGPWVTGMIDAAFHWMFTRTEAFEIVTRVPKGHIAAKAAAEATGMIHEFTRENGMIFRDKPHAAHLYRMTVQDWVPRAARLEERGAWLHGRMAEEAMRLGLSGETHEDDPLHNRYAGAAVDMAFGGQVGKGVALYNRWVMMARHERKGRPAYVFLASIDPPAISMDLGIMTFDGRDIRIERTC